MKILKFLVRIKIYYQEKNDLFILKNAGKNGNEKNNLVILKPTIGMLFIHKK